MYETDKDGQALRDVKGDAARRVRGEAARKFLAEEQRLRGERSTIDRIAKEIEAQHARVFGKARAA